MTESSDWTEALKLASQHPRSWGTYDKNGYAIICQCGAAGMTWPEHIASLQRPQPKPEPRYVVEGSQIEPGAWFICDHLQKKAKTVVVLDLPNAEARARALCDELNGEPAAKKPRFTLRESDEYTLNLVYEGGVYICEFVKLIHAQEFCAWKNAQETQP